MTHDPLNIKKKQEKQEDLIENKRALRLSHIPEELKFREKELDKIVEETIMPPINGEEGDGNMVTGKKGTGKTAAIKYLLRQLEDHYDTSEMEHAYINCQKNDSPKQVIRSLANQLDIEYQKGESVGFNTKKVIRQFSDEEDESLLVILDEVDELHKGRKDYLSDLLYSLTRPSSNIESKEETWDGDLTLTCISNDSEVYDYIREDVDDSSYSPNRSEFLEYSKEEIAEILRSRQQEAFAYDVLDKESTEKLAELVYEKFDSDIRMAIRILKKCSKKLSVDQVETGNYDSKKVVESAIEDVKRNMIGKVLNGKDRHFLLIMSSMIQNIKEDRSRLSRIVEGYREACVKAAIEKNGSGTNKKPDESKSRSRSFVRRKLEYLVEEDILKKEKREDIDRKPYFYYLNVDLELFDEMVHERLSRKGIADRMKDIQSSEEKEAEKEYKEKMEELGVM